MTCLGMASSATIAQAQQAQSLPAVTAEGEAAEEPYRMGEGADSGTSTIARQQIQARAPGSGDVNQVLKAIPTLQFSREEFLATRESIQDLRPSEISISGGRAYENLLMVDGIGANSRVDFTNDNPLDLQNTAGASPQSLWVDSSLVGEITVRDSNVSAAYGGFTGGVVDIKTRDPRQRFGAEMQASYTGDGITHFNLPDASRDALGGILPAKPQFDKWRFGGSVDVPLSDNASALFAYNRSRADVTYFRNATYGGRSFGQSSVSDNYLAKLLWDLGGELTLRAQGTYSPYTSEASSANAINNQVKSKGGGASGKIELAQGGGTPWSVEASYIRSDTSRTAPAGNYSLPSNTPTGGFCSSASCTQGGFGDIDQVQQDVTLKGRIAHDLWSGVLSGGVEYDHVHAEKERLQTDRAYLGSVVSPLTSCAGTGGLDCVENEYALTRYLEYRAYDARATLDSVSAWAQYDLTAGRWALRAGLRYDYESFLGNSNVAPRLSATYSLPWQGWSVTLGANRYYGRSMLAYALREGIPDSYTYQRTATIVGGRRVYSDNWALTSVTRAATYSRSSLETPYSDELTGAVNGRVLGGTLRIKGIYRDNKDEFSRSAGETLTAVLENGVTRTYTNYTMTNDGGSTYRGVSFEWVRSFGKHSLSFSANYSRTKTDNDDFLVENDETSFEDVRVLYQGQPIAAIDLAERNRRLDFAAPLLLDLTWTALWLDDRITTQINLHYRNGFDRIEDAGTTAQFEGVRYDVYDMMHYKSSLDTNLNVTAELIRSKLGTLSADARIANLLNRIPAQDAINTSQPYQYGRSVWFGLKYAF